MDDGAKTYIQMLSRRSRELPVLVVKGRTDSEMINYRVKDNMYIVDRLFDRAASSYRVGKTPMKVELIRQVGVTPRKAASANSPSPTCVGSAEAVVKP